VTDPRELLRRYLEQRRELGEREFVLDSLSVEEAMRILGARPASAGGVAAVPRNAETTDWRAALRAAGAAPSAPAAANASEREVEMPREAPLGSHDPPEHPLPRDAHQGIPASTPEIGGELAPLGIVVGGTTSDLFGAGGPSLDSVEQLENAIATCTRCSLYATAKNPVPGEGNPDADFMLVGEAPGATEDETGRPFVGQAGQLLDKILGAIKLERRDVFICNVLKHRPPGNRNPRPEEVSACSPYLVRQIELVRPKVIVALGTFAAQTLLETKLSIGKLRGQIHRYYGVPLIVTYHPAALLRNPAWKRPTWEDVQLARRILDRAVSGA
jgi:DNA polymerase